MNEFSKIIKQFKSIELELREEIGFYFDVKNGEINQDQLPCVFSFHLGYDVANDLFLLCVNGYMQKWKTITIEANSVLIIVPDVNGSLYLKEKQIPKELFNSEPSFKALVKELALEIRNKMIEKIQKNEGAKP
jgi:hypothetical protein